MTIGHPDLVAAIISEITQSGPIPFVRFMDLALYHPQYGYYMRAPDPGTERIGWSGDFYTNSDVHPILGQALAKQAAQIDALLGHPDPFTIVEMGPGKGLLIADVLREIVSQDRTLSRRVRYVLIERSPTMRAVQQQQLKPWVNQQGLITWLEDIRSLAPESVTGLLFSNELPDAFPVHRLQITGSQAQEVFVDYQDGRFVERLGPLSVSRLGGYLERMGIRLQDGYRAEVNLSALDWIQQVAASLHRGVVITIDYGHTAHDLYGPERSKGSLICYRSQMTSEDPYLLVGQQDMTTHVDFTALATAGEESDLSVTGFTNQMSFLMGLGAEDIFSRLEQDSPQWQAALHLLKPDGMGSTFKILVQHKGIERPELDGLKYKPFFGSALSLHAAA